MNNDRLAGVCHLEELLLPRFRSEEIVRQKALRGRDAITHHPDQSLEYR